LNGEKENIMEDKNKKYPEGYFLGMWMGIFIAIFSGIGIPLSVATKNIGFIGVGPALGVAIGLAVGQSIENKYKEQGKIRPLTKGEQKNKKMAVIAGLIILLLGVAAFLFVFFR